MLSSFFRWNIFFYFITEKDHAYFIIIIDRAEGEYRSYLCNNIAFASLCCPKQATGADIHQQVNNQLSFFFKYFGKRMRETRAYIPINKTDIITMIILAHFAKAHPLSFKC